MNDSNPNKLYFSISEVCELLDVKPHVLRYWESEFKDLKPRKNRAGNRAYRARDIEILKRIKHLLYDEKFTIDGAKQSLEKVKGSVNQLAIPFEDKDVHERLQYAIQQISSVKDLWESFD
jgi:DNA-binding transcriptional MerR regulator